MQQTEALQIGTHILKPVPAPTPKDLLAPPDFVPHWNETVTDEEYHADRTSVGSTQVRMGLDSPAALYEKYWGDQKPVDEEDEADHFKVGKMVHMAILENKRFKETYITMPEFVAPTQDGKMSAQSKGAKEKRAAWLADLPPGAKVCTTDQLDMITGIAEAIMRHPQGPKLLKDCKPEIAGYYRDPETGLRCRIKADLIKIDGSALTDMKTAKSSDEVFFGSQAFNHRYDIQLFMYREGARIINGKTPDLLTSLVIEKKRPFEPAIFFWTPEDLIQAEVDYRAGLRKIRNCIEENKWPFRQENISRIRTPQWFIHRVTNGGM